MFLDKEDEVPVVIVCPEETGECKQSGNLTSDEELRAQYEAEAALDPNIPPFEVWAQDR